MDSGFVRFKEFISDYLRGIKREILYHSELKLLFMLLFVFILTFFVFHFFNFLATKKTSSSDLSTRFERKEAHDSIFKTEAEKEKTIFVYITGAVKKPGVYKLKEGSRLYELLELAIPEKDSAHRYLNQAQPLSDGEMIYVPRNCEVSETLTMPFNRDNLPADLRGTSAGAKVNINKASKDELEQLPGVGPKTAEKIVEYRKRHGRIRNLSDLLNIDGLGEKKVEKLKDLIVF